ncbi:hypothetical protein ACTA71_004024 [Dictyostelium dimigraforme]
MKIILLILIIISIYNFSLSSPINKISTTATTTTTSSSSTLNKRYILMQGYNFVDNECKRDIVNTVYIVDGGCYFGNVYSSREDGKIVYDMYEGNYCNSSIVMSLVMESNVCDSNSSQSYPTVYSVVDSIDLPNNGFIVYTSKEEESNPNHDCGNKEDIINLVLIPLNICINDDPTYSFIQTCNSTNYLVTKYYGPSCEGGPIGYATGEITCEIDQPNEYSSQYSCL